MTCMRSCLAMVGSMCAGIMRMRSPTFGSGPPSEGENVVCSSDTNHTSPPSTVGLPWSMAIALSPASSTAHPFGLTEITVDQRNKACSNGCPDRP